MKYISIKTVMQEQTVIVEPQESVSNLIRKFNTDEGIKMVKPIIKPKPVVKPKYLRKIVEINESHASSHSASSTNALNGSERVTKHNYCSSSHYSGDTLVNGIELSGQPVVGHPNRPIRNTHITNTIVSGGIGAGTSIHNEQFSSTKHTSNEHCATGHIQTRTRNSSSSTSRSSSHTFHNRKVVHSNKESHTENPMSIFEGFPSISDEVRLHNAIPVFHNTTFQDFEKSMDEQFHEFHEQALENFAHNQREFFNQNNLIQKSLRKF